MEGQTIIKCCDNCKFYKDLFDNTKWYRFCNCTNEKSEKAGSYPEPISKCNEWEERENEREKN